tara:strand:+ start:253 stop:504 length:252 start_codon:yes stop_codon:yes gene_type:complete
LIFVIEYPRKSAKNIIDNISPFTSAKIGFVGIILNIKSLNEADVSKSSLGGIEFELSREKYIPGCTVLARNSPIRIAIKDVKK